MRNCAIVLFARKRIGTKNLLPLTIVVLVASSGSGVLAQAPTSQARAEVSLHEYVIGFLRRNPNVNTYLGGSSLDASLREIDGSLPMVYLRKK
jgi:hypothetical protein